MALHAFADLTNWGLQKIPGASFHIDEVEINPLSGHVSLLGVQAKTTPPHGPAIEVHIARCAADFQWRALLRGQVIADILIDRPQMSVTLPPEGQKPVPAENSDHPLRRKDDKTWQDKAREAIPFLIRRVLIRNGSIYLQNIPGQDGIDPRLTDFQLAIRNLTNREGLDGTEEATMQLEGRLMSHGWIHAKAQGYPFAKSPTFNFDGELQGLNLEELRPLIRHWAEADVQHGTASLYLEMAAAKDSIKGYVKPVVDNLKVEKSHPGLMQSMKIAAVKALTALLRNPKEPQRIATRADFFGRLDNPDINYGASIGNLLRNAFAKAFPSQLEHSVRFLREGTRPQDAEISLPEKKHKRLRAFFDLVKDTFTDWIEQQVPRHSAALSYYTAFSIAPLLLLLVALVGLIFGQKAVQGEIVGQISHIVGSQSAQAIQSMMQAMARRSSGVIATIIGIISLLAGASGVMSELKKTLNQIWHVQEPSGLGATVKGMLMSYAMVLAIGFVLLVSLVLSAVMSAAGKFVGGLLPIPEFFMQAANLLISFGVITLLFALIYKILPDTSIRWKDVWVGSAVTALLFAVGKLLIGLYLGKTGVTSSYGAAGSVLVLLLWVYYSAMILYFGAAFTKVFTDRFGSRSLRTAYPQSRN